MINDLLALINPETIYLMANWGVIPFWAMLIIIPNHGLQIFCSINYSSLAISIRIHVLKLQSLFRK